MSIPLDSVRVLDELVRTDLDQLRETCFTWLLRSSWAVVIGALLEGPEVIWETREWFRRRRSDELTADSSTGHHTPSWIVVASLFGWIVISIGIAGEGISEGFVSKADGLLQTFNNILLTDASDRASANEKEAGEAREKAAEAEEHAAQLEAQIQPRRLTKDQQRSLSVSLSRFSGKTVVIATYSLDVEGIVLAAQIADSLTAANINVRNGIASINSMGLPVVMGIEIDSGPGYDQRLIKALVESLDLEAHLKVTVAPVRVGIGTVVSVPAGQIPGAFIIVGVKPTTLAQETALLGNIIEEGRSEQTKIRERIVDRHLTAEQQSRIAKSVCKFGGINVDIGLYSPDGEIEKLGKELNGALPESCDGNLGFVVSIVPKLTTRGFSGVQIIVKEGTSQKSKSFANALAVTLREVGIQVDGPMPEPKRGAVIPGGAEFKRSAVDGLSNVGFENATPVEIAIGKKP